MSRDTPLRVALMRPDSPMKSDQLPLGLAYLSAAFGATGQCEVYVYDLAAVNGQVSERELLDELGQSRFDLLGVQVATYHLADAYRLLDRLRHLTAERGGRVVAGGPHATLFPAEVLSHGADVVVRGEGEQTAAELVEHLRGRRPLASVGGISYRDDAGAVHHNPDRPPLMDLDQLPRPDRDAFRAGDYGPGGFGQVAASRGCPGRCTYCDRSVFGGRIRHRSPGAVVAELAELQASYGLDHVVFVDSLLNWSARWLGQLCQLLHQARLPLTWWCSARARGMTPSLLEQMGRAGCVGISYGVESGNPETLERVGKQIALDTIESVLGETRRAGILAHANFIFGFPWEGRGEVETTLRFMRRISAHVDRFNLALLTPIPGTPLFEDTAQAVQWWLEERPRTTTFSQLMWQTFFYDLPASNTFFRHDPQTLAAIERATRFCTEANLAQAARRQGVPTALARPLLGGAARALLGLYRHEPRVDRWLTTAWGASHRLRHLPGDLPRLRDVPALGRLVWRRAVHLTSRRLPRGWSERLARPSTVTFAHTHRCTLRCRHCDYWQHPTEELPTAVWLDLIDQLRRWLGSYYLCFSGGESLARADCLPLLDHAHRAGVRVLLNTNGTAVDSPTARSLMALGVHTLTLSLYSLSAEVHDGIRGAPGAHAAAMAALDHLLHWRRALGARSRLRLGVLLCRQNLDRLDRLLRWCEARGLRVILQPLFQTLATSNPVDDWRRSSPLWPLPDQIPELARLETLKRRGYPIDNSAAQLRAFVGHYTDEPPRGRCGASDANLVVEPRGDVRLCYGSPVIGNVTEVPIRRIWSSPAAHQERLRLQSCRRECAILNCNFDRKGARERLGELRHFV